MEERLITVTATASDKAPADTVSIALTAVSSAKKYADATDAADVLANNAVADLKNAGFENIKALGVNVSTLRDSGNKISGYRATRSFSIEFGYDKARMARAIEVLDKSACEWRISFLLKDRSAADGLLEHAVESAHAAANRIATAAGVKLGALCKADYSSNDGAARPMMLRAAICDDGAANSAEPCNIDLSETVTCSWKIE